MATYNLERFRKVMAARIKRIEQNKNRTLNAAANHMMMNAKRNAPRKTGETQTNIFKHKVNKNHYQVISWVKGAKGFKQNMWANRTPPYDKPRMFWTKPPYQPVLYGVGHKVSTLPGKIPFFTSASISTRKFFTEHFISGVRRAMRVTV